MPQAGSATCVIRCGGSVLSLYFLRPYRAVTAIWPAAPIPPLSPSVSPPPLSLSSQVSMSTLSPTHLSSCRHVCRFMFSSFFIFIPFPLSYPFHTHSHAIRVYTRCYCVIVFCCANALAFCHNMIVFAVGWPGPVMPAFMGI